MIRKVMVNHVYIIRNVINHVYMIRKVINHVYMIRKVINNVFIFFVYLLAHCNSKRLIF
jgi:hypothetical protein